jgi:hypothetical protein
MADLPDAVDFDTCKARTMRCVLRWRAAGLDARWIQVAGMRVPAPDADRRWSVVLPAARVHYVVLVDGEYHDLASQQFWPDLPSPLVEREYMLRWERFYDITDTLP